MVIMKVKVLAHKGMLVFNVDTPEQGVDGLSWSPVGDGRFGNAVKAVPELLGISKEALELMSRVKRCNDGVGDLMWSSGAFSWFGSIYRIMDPNKAEVARTFRITEGEYSEIPNEFTPSEMLRIEHAIRIDSYSWSWPSRLHEKIENGAMPYATMFTDYHTGLVYVASAYSHDDKDVVEARRAIAGNLCASLIAKGVHAVSPVVYGTALMEFGQMKEDTSWNSWQEFCNAILANAQAVYVINSDGWDKSIGVGQEMLEAATRGIPVFMIDPDTLALSAVPHRLPITKLTKEDAAEISSLLGKKYSHHDVYRRGYEMRGIKDIRIMMYASSHGMASVAITGRGEIVDPFMPGGFGDLLKMVKGHIERLISEGKADDKELKDLQERKASIEADLPSPENMEKAKQILNKYLL